MARAAPAGFLTRAEQKGAFRLPPKMPRYFEAVRCRKTPLYNPSDAESKASSKSDEPKLTASEQRWLIKDVSGPQYTADAVIT